MYKITDNLLRYADHFLKNHDFGLTNREFDVFRHESAACFIPLVKWSEPLIQYQDIYDVKTRRSLWTSSQTMRYAVGASLISLCYKRHMTYDNMQNAVIAKAFDKFQVGILDDIIDRGEYNYEEAKSLYTHVIGSMSSPEFDYIEFQKELNDLLNPSQLELSDLISSIASAFSTFFLEAPRIEEVIPIIKMLDQRIIEGQALTVCQKESHLDLEKMKSESESYYAPDDDLKWYEKLASYISGGAKYNIIDIAYTDDDFDWKYVEDIQKAWYFFDINVVLLNNIIDIENDLENGIYNLSLIDMKDGDISSVDKGNPNITISDYKEHILRNAEIAKRGFHYVNGGQDNKKTYLFLTMMIPLVMMTEWVGKRDDMIELFLNNVS